MANRKTFTGRARERRTRWSVRFVDRAASWLITVGGVGTIAAVSAVCLYLLWTVLPLFWPSTIGQLTATPQQPLPDAPIAMRIADSGQIAWAIGRDGGITVFRPGRGELLQSVPPSADAPEVTAIATALSRDDVAFGYADGTVQLGAVRFEIDFLSGTGEQAAAFESLQPGESVTVEDGVVQRTTQGLLRRETVAIEFSGEPIEVSPGQAVRRLDTIAADSGPVLLAWSEDGIARIATIGRRENLFTGEVTLEAGTIADLQASNLPTAPPLFVGLSARAAGANLVWSDGTLVRFDIRNRSKPQPVERTDLTEGDATLTAVRSLIGRLTLLAGDSNGNVSAWFPVRSDAEGDGTKATEEQEVAVASDRSRFLKGHDLGDGPAAVAAIAPSSRSREAAIGYADGTVRIYQVTTEDELVESRLPVGDDFDGPVTLYLPPGEGETTLYAAADDRLFAAPLDLGHPDSAISGFFRPIWYESYSEPQHVWQTSSGTNAAEPKLGLMPLIFGTLKATFYSMLFGVPLALLAALYTSEFLSKPVRSRVKPVIEIMASLPSVVLGFLAAIVFAPVVEAWLPAVIAAGLTVPLSLLAAAHLWQLGTWSGLPRWDRWRLPLAGMAILCGIVLAMLVGPLFEAVFFAGNITRWLNGQIGSGAGAWMLLLVPVTAVGVAAAIVRWLNPIVSEASSRWGRRRFATVDLLRFGGAVIVTFAIAALLSLLLAELDSLLPIDLDPRGGVFDTYVQRNALVVGFVMGFAIIPLIYTLADDALNAVPEALRSASLGAGATHWQTALRVVIPAAMSGLFSAVMVGLGRAVGETMIVLMAAGNTPIMEINLFNGFQTLSAAIATEMPEAVRGSTHFRTLFLAALVLFGMTFLVNTIAELVRIRFRRRVVQL